MMMTFLKIGRGLVVLVAISYLSSCTIGRDFEREDVVCVTGRVETDETHVTAGIPGKVLKVCVHEGEAVTRGQQLLLLDDSAYRRQLAWVNKLIEKGTKEKEQTEKLLSAMSTISAMGTASTTKVLLKRAKSHSNVSMAMANEPKKRINGWLRRADTLNPDTGVLLQGSGSVSPKAVDDADPMQNQLNELDRRHAEQRHRFDELSKQAEAEADSGFDQQRKILADSRQTENKILAKYNRFPFKLMRDDSARAVDELFDAKGKELEQLYILQKRSIAESGKMNQLALNEAFEMQKESIRYLEQARAKISAQLKRERQGIEELLKKKQLELANRLSDFEQPELMQKTLQELKSAESERQSFMKNLSYEQLAAKLAFIETERVKAEATRDEIKGKIKACSIDSPVDGNCVSCAVRPGEIVVPGPVLLKLANMKTAYLRAFVPAKQVTKIKVGQKAEIQIAALEKRAIPSIVNEIDTQPAFCPQNEYSEDELLERQYGIKCSLNIADDLARPGMTGRATISVTSRSVR
ncbi:MAG TPA: efflux RND transporter periplasmic adaptor subunit [Oculatellaceae cyanobacterium]